MLLFSTILDIRRTLTKDKFIELVLQWNRENPHKENIIPDIKWDHERNIRFGSRDLWLSIEEYRNKNIISVRYEKVRRDGVIWDTDYIMNFDEMRLSIQLDRRYTEGALNLDPAFSTPHFITTLIDNNCLRDDRELPILHEPTDITAENISMLADIINGKSHYSLPVVYVSKTLNGQNPVDIEILAKRLKGVAHVFVQKQRSSNYRLRELCGEKNEFNGAVGIYYPNTAVRNKRFLYRKYTGEDSDLLDKTARAVIRYCSSQNLPNLYTWSGVNYSLLSDRMVSQMEKREAAETEVDKVYDTFDDDFRHMQEQIDELTNANSALTMENQGLRAKLCDSDAVPVLTMGEEDDFYPDEIRDMVLKTLMNGLDSAAAGSRKAHILNDLIENNNYTAAVEERKQKIKTMFRGYKNMSGPLRQQLIDLGFEITEEGKHYKLTYFGDARYRTTLAKTASDNREGKNIASTIISNML